MQSKSETFEKYMNYLISLKKYRVFNLNQMRIQAKIGSYINNFLIKNEVVKLVGDHKYKWNGYSKSMEALLNEFFKTRDDYNRQYGIRLRRKKRNKAQKNRIGSVIEKPVHSEFTEKSAIDFLKNSPNYTYEIYRIKKEQL